jgi:hypothetical protein
VASPELDQVAGLRAWARGVYPLEAAVELLARFEDGRFARSGWAWIDHDSDTDWCVLDADRLTSEAVACLSGGERRVLALVASLAGGHPVDLADAVTGIDRATVRLVLAAIGHAAGSHEHVDIVLDPDRGVSCLRGTLPSLYPSPEPLHDGAAS